MKTTTLFWTIMLGVLFAAIGAQSKLSAQLIEQEFSNYSTYPDSTLRAEACVRAGDYWYCALRTSRYGFTSQMHSQVVQLNDSLQPVTISDYPNWEWNYLFSNEEGLPVGFGVRYISEYDKRLVGAQFTASADTQYTRTYSAPVPLAATTLYDAIETPFGYTLLYGYFQQVPPLVPHFLGLVELSHDLEIIRDTVYTGFPDMSQLVTLNPNYYRLGYTTTGNYALVGNHVTWISGEDLSVVSESEIGFIYPFPEDPPTFYVGYYLGPVLTGTAAEDEILVSIAVHAGNSAAGGMATDNDVGVHSLSMDGELEEVFRFGAADTNDSVPLKGFIKIDDGYLIVARSFFFYYAVNVNGEEHLWPTNIRLAKLNNEMELEWELALVDDDITTVTGVTQDPEAGTLLFGQRRYLDSGEFFAHLMLLPNNPVSVPDNVMDASDITLYPNPTKGLINIDIEGGLNEYGGASMRVIDASGKVWHTQTLGPSSNSADIQDLNALPAGQYWLIVHRKEKQPVYKPFVILK